MRLKGPADAIPEVRVSSTQSQGGQCLGRPTHDLVLVFSKSPDSWIEGLSAAVEGSKQKKTAFSPCETNARPLKEGFEIRLSYPKPKLSSKEAGSQLKTLVFKTSDSLVIDHWITKSLKPQKKETPYWDTSGEMDAGSVGGVPLRLTGTLLDVFEDQMEWEKALGSNVTAYDLNSPELDRFRWPQADPVLGIPTEPIERRRLELPYFDFPSMDQSVGFAEEKITFDRNFVESDLHLEKSPNLKPTETDIKQTLEGLNFVITLARKNDWLRALKALEVLEKSKYAKFIPRNTIQLTLLRGNVYLQLGKELKDKNFQNKGVSIWRDGLRNFAGEGGDNVEFLEKMLLETIRLLFKEGLSYAAAGTLSWAQGYSWSKRTEERLSFLRGEAFFQLGLYDESFKTFDRFFTSRADKPLNTSVDRRLVPAAAFRLGDIRMRQEKFAEAKMEYTRAINQIPTLSKFSFEGSWYPNELALFPHVFFNRAEASLRLGLEQNALKDLRSFIFITPNHTKVGLVLFRIGEVLKNLGAADDMVTNAWRECIFRVPETLGAKLCEARKAALEITTSPKTSWPRLIGTVEAALPKGIRNFWDSVPPEDLEVYVNLVLSDAFIRRGEAQQAWLRLDSIRTKEPSAYLKAWTHEYSVVAFTGLLDNDLSKGAYKNVVSEYEKRKTVLFFGATRAEVLWRVAVAYERLRLLKEAKTTLDQADQLKQKVNRQISRPFDPTLEDWNYFRAKIETDILADDPRNAENSKNAIEKLMQNKIQTQRLWVRYGELAKDFKIAKEAWEFIRAKEGLSWSDVESYAKVLADLKEPKGRLDLLEGSVGVWFLEKDKLKTAENGKLSKTPPLVLLLKLADARFEVDAQKDKSLAVYDFLLLQEDGELAKFQITKPMVSYKKGIALKKFGKYTDARTEFNSAFTAGPDTLWGKLSASEVKELDSKSL